MCVCACAVVYTAELGTSFEDAPRERGDLGDNSPDGNGDKGCRLCEPTDGMGRASDAVRDRGRRALLFAPVRSVDD